MPRSATANLESLFDLPFQSDADGHGLDHVLEWVRHYFSADAASVFLGPDSDQTYRLAHQSGLAQIPHGAKIIAGHGIAGAAINANEPRLVLDPQRDSETQSAMVIPLSRTDAHGTLSFGVLNLSRHQANHPFGDADLRRAAAIAQYLSLAIAHSRLIGQLREAVNAAESAHQRLDAALRCVGVAVVVLDSGRFVRQSNEAAQKLLNVQNGQPLDLAGHPLQETIQSLVPQDGGRRIVRNPSQDQTFEVVLTAIADNGYLLAVADVSEHYRTTRELARVSRLAEIGQMSAAIAHEIRNPLTGIRSAAQMVKIAPEQSAEFAAIIEEEVMKLNALCEEFLDFARPLSLRVGVLDLGRLAQTVIERTQSDALARSVGLSFVGTTDGPILRGDLLRIEQVMRNLVRNAIQACQPGDRVVICIRDDGFDVQDTGQGMSEEIRERLFTPFFTTKSDGTGLGLSTVKKIVDAHDGSLSVWSEVGVGTRFEVRLPHISAENWSGVA